MRAPRQRSIVGEFVGIQSVEIDSEGCAAVGKCILNIDGGQTAVTMLIRFRTIIHEPRLVNRSAVQNGRFGKLDRLFAAVHLSRAGEQVELSDTLVPGGAVREGI